MSSLIELTRTIHSFRTIHNYIMHVCTMHVYIYSVDRYLLCMIQNISSNELARPVMGTIFLVIVLPVLVCIIRAIEQMVA